MSNHVRFGSVCSGIEAASNAWEPLGWEPTWFSEIEPFPSALLAHYWPGVKNLGDMAEIHHGIDSETIEPPEVLVGGTPCQAFSVAGLRQSLEDARGQLTLHFVGLANAIDRARERKGLPPCIIVWENVPGVLNTPDNAFGCFLGALAGEAAALVPPGGRWTNAGVVAGPSRTIAWRVLDAQYFGVAQRRRRVFLVASARNDFDPAAVLFESEGLRRDSAPSRETGEGSSGSPASGATFRCGGIGSYGPSGGVSATLLKSGQELGPGCEALFVPDLSPTILSGSTSPKAHGKVNGTDRGALVGLCATGDVFHTLRAEGFDASEDGTVKCAGGKPGQGYPAALVGMQVRRLTPVECERLQGFPDSYTQIPWPIAGQDVGNHACQKQIVRATIRTPQGRYYIATNNTLVHAPEGCPRAGMPTGDGYDLCRDVCQQRGHAEVNVLRLAGKKAKGSTLYVEGHTYLCDECKEAAQRAGVAEIVLGPPPGEDCPDGPRYKALGNSMCVKVMHWVGTRIAQHLQDVEK